MARARWGELCPSARSTKAPGSFGPSLDLEGFVGWLSGIRARIGSERRGASQERRPSRVEAPWAQRVRGRSQRRLGYRAAVAAEARAVPVTANGVLGGGDAGVVPQSGIHDGKTRETPSSRSWHGAPPVHAQCRNASVSRARAGVASKRLLSAQREQGPCGDRWAVCPPRRGNAWGMFSRGHFSLVPGVAPCRGNPLKHSRVGGRPEPCHNLGASPKMPGLSGRHLNGFRRRPGRHDSRYV